MLLVMLVGFLSGGQAASARAAGLRLTRLVALLDGTIPIYEPPYLVYEQIDALGNPSSASIGVYDGSRGRLRSVARGDCQIDQSTFGAPNTGGLIPLLCGAPGSPQVAVLHLGSGRIAQVPGGGDLNQPCNAHPQDYACPPALDGIGRYWSSVLYGTPPPSPEVGTPQVTERFLNWPTGRYARRQDVYYLGDPNSSLPDTDLDSARLAPTPPTPRLPVSTTVNRRGWLILRRRQDPPVILSHCHVRGRCSYTTLDADHAVWVQGPILHAYAIATGQRLQARLPGRSGPNDYYIEGMDRHRVYLGDVVGRDAAAKLNLIGVYEARWPPILRTGSRQPKPKLKRCRSRCSRPT